MPRGDWYCRSCLCRFCGSAQEKTSSSPELLSCSQCSRKCKTFYYMQLSLPPSLPPSLFTCTLPYPMSLQITKLVHLEQRVTPFVPNPVPRLIAFAVQDAERYKVLLSSIFCFNLRGSYLEFSCITCVPFCLHICLYACDSIVGGLTACII
jgi:hypothetical protein